MNASKGLGIKSTKIQVNLFVFNALISKDFTLILDVVSIADQAKYMTRRIRFVCVRAITNGMQTELDVC